VTLLHDGVVGSVRLRSRFRLVNLPVQTLEALDACHVSGFRNLHCLNCDSSRQGTDNGCPYLFPCSSATSVPT